MVGHYHRIIYDDDFLTFLVGEPVQESAFGSSALLDPPCSLMNAIASLGLMVDLMVGI